MYVLSFLASVLAWSCLGVQAQKPPQTAELAAAASDPFPAPKSGIKIAIGPGEDMKIEALLDRFSEVTGQVLLIDPSVRQLMRSQETGLNRSVDVPASEVYPFVETILSQNEFVLTVLSAREPRLLGVHSLTQGPERGSLRNGALQVSPQAIASYDRHPAVLVTTTLDLPHVDVRTLSNSLRALYTDANTQQIIPVGNSNSVILTGLGRNVASQVAMLRECDEIARVSEEKHEKERAQERELERQRRAEERKSGDVKSTSQEGEAVPAKQEKPN